MLQMLLSAAWAAIARLLGLESVVELDTAIVGLSSVAIGFAAWWSGA